MIRVRHAWTATGEPARMRPGTTIALAVLLVLIVGALVLQLVGARAG